MGAVSMVGVGRLRKIEFRCRIRIVKYHKKGNTYYVYRIHVPSRYIRDGHIDPEKPVRVIVIQEE